MNVRDLARIIHSGYHLTGPKDDPSYTMTREEYADYLEAENQRRWETGEAQKEFLFHGSETRAQLSETEITALANKYNVRDMDDASYDALLDDLESMGAISTMEKKLLGYHNMRPAGYTDADGEWVSLGTGMWSASEENLIFMRRDADGDVWKWINDRMKWRAAEDNAPAGRTDIYEQAHKVLLGIVNRIGCERPKNRTEVPEPEEASDRDREELLRQIKDPEGNFFGQMQQQILESAEKRQEEQREQATIDALGAILDSLSGKEDDRRQDTAQEVANGVKLGLNADQRSTFQEGFVPLELQVFLRSLSAGKGMQLGEEDEEQTEKVQETGSAAAEKLYAGSAQRKSLDRDAIAELARKYDPHNMDDEAYDAFLDDLVEAGVLSREETRKIGYGGMVEVSLDEMHTVYTGPLDTDPFERAPSGSDILGWLENRMLWEPVANTQAERVFARREAEMLNALHGVLSGMERQRGRAPSEII